MDNPAASLRPEANVLVLYSGQHCHLCETAKTLIYSVLPSSWQLRVVDINNSPSLQALYGERIPVVATCDGEKGWPFTEGQLKKIVAGTYF